MNITQTKYAITRLTEITVERVKEVAKENTAVTDRANNLGYVTVGDFLDSDMKTLPDLDRSKKVCYLSTIFDLAELTELAEKRKRDAFGLGATENAPYTTFTVKNPLNSKDFYNVTGFVLPKYATEMKSLQDKLNTAADTLLLSSDAEEVLQVINNF